MDKDALLALKHRVEASNESDAPPQKARAVDDELRNVFGMLRYGDRIKPVSQAAGCTAL